MPAAVEFENEIAEAFFAPQVVAFAALAFTDQDAVFDSPEFIRILFLEVGEIFTVEQILKDRFVGFRFFCNA